MKKKVSASGIEAARSKRGGWGRATLAKWGVPWPPPGGWRRALEAGEFDPADPIGSIRRTKAKAAVARQARDLSDLIDDEDV